MQRNSTVQALTALDVTKESLDASEEEVELLLPSYSKQIIIDFIHNASTTGLKHKWDAKHINNPCVVVAGADVMQQAVRCESTAGVVRLYIHAHGDRSKDYIVGGNGDARKYPRITSAALAKALAAFIGSQNVIVNLLACSAACGHIDHTQDTSKNSFAAKLQLQLTLLAKRHILVVARRTPVNISPKFCWIDIPIPAFGTKSTWSLTFKQAGENILQRANFFLIHKQYAAKVFFAINEEDGRQYRLDAYKLLWKKRIFEVLDAELDENNGTYLREKRRLLEQWKKDFLTKTKSEMQNIMQAELDNPDSVLKKHSAPCIGFFVKSNAEKRIAALVEERKRILGSKYSQDMIATGWRLPRKNA